MHIISSIKLEDSYFEIFEATYEPKQQKDHKEHKKGSSAHQLLPQIFMKPLKAFFFTCVSIN